MPSEDSNTSITIVYDGDCPFCSRYVSMMRLRESVGTVNLVNARESANRVVADVKNRGYDLNAGMVAIYHGAYFHGADCIHLIAGLSSDSGAFNRINSILFRSKMASRLIYPILRAGRDTTLALMGRKKLP